MAMALKYTHQYIASIKYSVNKYNKCLDRTLKAPAYPRPLSPRKPSLGLKLGLYNCGLTEQFVKRQKEKRCLVYFKGFAQTEINDVGLLRLVFIDETA